MTAPPRHLRIFLSSPGDVAGERARIRRILRDLPRSTAWKGKFTLEAISWDDPDAPVPMDAHLTPQQAVDRHVGTPSQCDLVVALLWSRMGTPLATPLKADGSRYLSGTEYELADALAAEPGPRVLIYRRDDEAELGGDTHRQQQFETVRGFADGLVAAGRSVMGYRGVDAFAKRFRKDLQGVLRELEEGVGDGPPLELQTFEHRAAGSLHYRTRAAALVGRTAEWRALQAFLEADTPYAWWALGGEGGAGKSRLALESALSMRDRWRAGFLPPAHGFGAWHDWLPRRPTLLIVDYAQRHAGLQPMLLALSQRQRPAGAQPLRVLLLERETDEASPTWLQLIGTGTTALALRATLHAAPLPLPPLDDGDVILLLQQSMAAETFAALPPREELLPALDRIDALRRPLFLLMAADALAAGKDLRHWDRERLLDDHLAREDAAFWAPAGVTDRDRHLLALVTMTGGLAVQRLRELSADDCLPTAEPGPRRFSALRYAAMSGAPSRERLDPLKPDPVGEHFVLRLLQPEDALDDRAQRLWRQAARLDPIGAFSFLQRCSMDAPDHPTLALLGEIDETDARQRLVGVFDLFFRQRALLERQGADALVARYRQTAALVERHATLELVRTLDAVNIDYVKLIGEHGRRADARESHEQLLVLLERSDATGPADWAFSIERAHDLIVFSCQAGQTSEALALLGHLKALMQHDPRGTIARQQLAAATFNVCTCAAQQGEIDTALAVWRSLEPLASEDGADPLVREHWLDAAMNIAVLADRSGRSDGRDHVLDAFAETALGWAAEPPLPAVWSRLAIIVASQALNGDRAELAVEAASSWLKRSADTMDTESLAEGLGTAAAIVHRATTTGALDDAVALLLASFDRLARAAGQATAPWPAADGLVSPYAELDATNEALVEAGRIDEALQLIHRALDLQPHWQRLGPAAGGAMSLAITTANESFRADHALRSAERSTEQSLRLFERSVAASRAIDAGQELTVALLIVAFNLLSQARQQGDGALALRVMSAVGGDLESPRLRQVVAEEIGVEPFEAMLDYARGTGRG